MGLRDPPEAAKWLGDTSPAPRCQCSWAGKPQTGHPLGTLRLHGTKDPHRANARDVNTYWIPGIRLAKTFTPKDVTGKPKQTLWLTQYFPEHSFQPQQV